MRPLLRHRPTPTSNDIRAGGTWCTAAQPAPTTEHRDVDTVEFPPLARGAPSAHPVSPRVLTACARRNDRGGQRGGHCTHRGCRLERTQRYAPDRITTIAESLPIPDGATVIDLTGRTVTPVSWIAALTSRCPPAIARSATATVLASNPVLKTMLLNGFTTIRDLMAADLDNNTLDLRDAIAAGLVPGPRMLVAPHLISARGGRCAAAARRCSGSRGFPWRSPSTRPSPAPRLREVFSE